MNFEWALYHTGVLLLLLLTAGLAPGLQAQDSAAADPASSQEGQIDFQARDSLIFNFRGNRVASLHGSSRVTHSAGELTAGTIAMDLDRHLVSAETATPGDTLSQPVLIREQERIRSRHISFNYESGKGRFEVARMEIEEGNLIGERVKNTSPHVIFIEDGIYTTCTLDHPHYYLKAERMKVVDREEVFFTNARLYILDIPYPLAFPFGYVPARIDRRQSGLLEPTYTYQETSTRGLGLQNLGWFQYFNDHIVGQAAVDIFTSGTFYLNASSSYSVRDKYSGTVRVGYSRERGLESTDPGFSINSQKSLGISHNQNFSPYANFSANINLRTEDFYRRNSYNIDERASTSTSSSLNYRYRHPENMYNLTISARQNQNFRTNIVRLSGPDMNFSLRPVSPFAGGGPSSETPGFLQGMTIRYQNSFKSDYSFTPIRGDSAEVNWFEALLDPSRYREATGNNDHYRYGMRHQASLSFGNLVPNPYVNVSLSGGYNEYWFPGTTRKSFNSDSNRIETEQVRGFTTARDFDTSLGISATIYGIMNRGIGSLEAFRHTLRPSLSFGYRPDFGSSAWGYYREVPSDTLGNTRTYSIFENQVFSGPGRGEQRALSLNISNVFEARQVSRDSTGEIRERTIRIIDRLDFQTSYNFAADSLRLSDLNTRFSTSVIEGLSINASAEFNFYQRDDQGNRVDRFLLEGGNRILEPLSWSVSASTSFEGGNGSGIQLSEPYYPEFYDPLDQAIFEGFSPRFNDRSVQRLASPWQVSLNFSYRWRLNPNGENSRSATLNANNIRFRLTPKWQVGTRIGYDFTEKELTPSRFSLTRNLHCWNLSFEINPFGDFQYFFFRLSIDSNQIQGLLQKLPGLNNLQRSSSPTGRGNPGGF